MRFKKIGMIASFILSTTVFAFPTLAKADDLNISNQTSYTLSFDVNGVCSADFGALGPYSVKSIPEKNFFDACERNTSPCQVKVYDNKDCKGELIAMVEYYMAQRFVNLEGYGRHKISIAVSAFYNLFFAEALPDQQLKK